MSASPKVALRPVAFELRTHSVAFPVESQVASSSPRSVLASALLRARKQRQAIQSKRIARRRSIDTASREPGYIISSASSHGSKPTVRLH